MSRLVFLLLALSVIPAASAQQQSSLQANSFQVAAGDIATALAQNRIPSVIVFDFSGPDHNVTVLGQNFAEDFSAALAKSGQGFQVEDRSLIGQALDRESVALQVSADPQFAIVLAQDLKAAAFVSGELKADAAGLSLKLSCFRTKDGKGIKSLSVAWPLNETIKQALAANPIVPDAGSSLVDYRDATKHGYAPPQCLYCPRADYTPEAQEHRAQGVVELVVVVGTDGHVHDINVVKSLPYGLTATAIRAAQRWKLQPARGPDGKPAAIREIIEMQFRLF